MPGRQAEEGGLGRDQKLGGGGRARGPGQESLAQGGQGPPTCSAGVSVPRQLPWASPPPPLGQAQRQGDPRGLLLSWIKAWY